MKLKRTSLLFNNGLRKAVNANPELQYTKGMQAAIKFVNDVIACNFQYVQYVDLQREMTPVEKLLCGASGAFNRLESALKETSRIATFLELYFEKYVKVKMLFFEVNKCTFTIETYFHIEDGESGSLSLGICPAGLPCHFM